MLEVNYRVRKPFKSGSKGLLQVGTILTPEEAGSLKNFNALLNTGYFVEVKTATSPAAVASSASVSDGTKKGRS